MSVHKKDINDLLEAFTAAAKRGNNSAINLIPALVTSLLHYVEEATGFVPAPTPTKTESKIEVLSPPAATTISDEDKEFAQAVATQTLAENGNATLETNAGNFAIHAAEDAAAEVLEVLTEEAVKAAEAQGATEITAVTAKVAGEAPEAEVEGTVEAEPVAEATETKKPAGKKK
jgi:hypothetical protein